MNHPTNRKPTNPGKILLEEFLIPLNISKSNFIQLLGRSWSGQKLNSIINSETITSRDIALDLANALGTTPEFWIDL